MTHTHDRHDTMRVQKKCNVCDYLWFLLRKSTKPLTCPRCRSTRWWWSKEALAVAAQAATYSKQRREEKARKAGTP